MAYDPYGDESIFLEPPPNKLQCSICLRNVQKEPYLTRCCGNHFCQTCIEHVQYRGYPCPLCKTAEIEIFPNQQQKRDINQIPVRCPQHRENNGQCDWKGDFGGLREHVIVNHTEVVFAEDDERIQPSQHQSCAFHRNTSRTSSRVVVMPEGATSIVVDTGFSPNLHMMASQAQHHQIMLRHPSTASRRVRRPAGIYSSPQSRQMYHPLSEHSYHVSVGNAFPIPPNPHVQDPGHEPSQDSTSSDIHMLFPNCVPHLVHHPHSHPEHSPHCHFVPVGHATNRGHRPVCPYRYHSTFHRHDREFRHPHLHEPRHLHRHEPGHPCRHEPGHPCRHEPGHPRRPESGHPHCHEPGHPHHHQPGHPHLHEPGHPHLHEHETGHPHHHEPGHPHEPGAR